jgi:hypothetical protein
LKVIVDHQQKRRAGVAGVGNQAAAARESATDFALNDLRPRSIDARASSAQGAKEKPSSYKTDVRRSGQLQALDYRAPEN